MKTLPWVETDSINPDAQLRQVKFRVKKVSDFDLKAVQAALETKGFADVTVFAGPGKTT